MTQVINDTGKETRLRSSQQKSQDVKGCRGPNKHHGHRDCAPTHHDSRYPPTCPHAMQNEITRHFEKAITQKEYSGTKTKCSWAKSQIGIHLQRRKTNIHTVEPRHNVENEQKRDQTQRHP